MIFSFNKPIRNLLFVYIVSIVVIAILLVIQQVTSFYDIYAKQISFATAFCIVFILLLQLLLIFNRAVVKIDNYVVQISRTNDELTRSLSQQQVLEKELRRKADELSSMNEVLQVGEERFRKLIEYNTVGIFIHDGQHIVYANPECTKILGRDMYSLFKTPMLGIIHPDFRDISGKKLTQMRKLKMKKTITLRADIQVINSEGESRWIDLSTSNAYEKSSFIATITDITERKRANDQIQEANKTIARRNDQMNQVLTEFKKQQEALMKQAASLHLANDAISKSQEELERKNKIIEKKNEDILASINYAKRIQNALLPSEKLIKESFKDLFIIYKPKDIVCGDFYWHKKLETENEIYTVVAAVDCTGHGVPGAFMSAIGMNILNKIVNDSCFKPGEILSKLHFEISKSLQNDDVEIRDGMDMSVVLFAKKQQKVWFSGAKNQIIYFQNNELFELKANKEPIGGQTQYADIAFAEHEINCDKNTIFYLFTDGFQDQFGGDENRKFMYKNLKTVLSEIHLLAFEDQKINLENKFLNWKKDKKQTDDVLVLGIKI
ncbi:MAG: PAS domain S-box protein [Cytophagales bacterium]|nr:MAG: PAS domain S-box protein [Cytophagales bacterium]